MLFRGNPKEISKLCQFLSNKTIEAEVLRKPGIEEENVHPRHVDERGIRQVTRDCQEAGCEIPTAWKSTREVDDR